MIDEHTKYVLYILLKLSCELCWVKEYLLVFVFSGGDGGEGGEEEDAGAQRAGETAGGRERTTAGTETGHTFSLSVCSHEEATWCDSVLLFVQEEDERRAKEEKDRREEEEYLRLKASFTIEDQGEQEQLSEDQVRSLIN